jgi:hypothetical protein
MAGWRPLKRRDFLRKLRELAFTGTYSGTRHQFMVFGPHLLNPKGWQKVAGGRSVFFPGTTTGHLQRGTGASRRDARRTKCYGGHANEFLGLSTALNSKAHTGLVGLASLPAPANRWSFSRLPRNDHRLPSGIPPGWHELK